MSSETIQDFARKVVEIDDEWFWYRWQEVFIEAHESGNEGALRKLELIAEEQRVTEDWEELLTSLK